MNSGDLFVLLAAYAISTSALLIFESFYRRSWVNVIGLATALIALVATTVLGRYAQPQTGAADLLLETLRGHSPRHLVVAAIGVAAALPWASRLLAAQDSDHRTRLPLAEQVLIVCSILGIAGGTGLMLWNTLFDLKAESSTQVFAEEFVVEEIALFDFFPTRVAVDDAGQVYVSYFWLKEDATYGGAIVKLTEDSETGSYTQKTVANHDLLFRVMGLATKDGDLYVSRSGYHANADAGRIYYEDTGAVTRLKDLNGDGYFDYYDDIVTGMPGARGPHIQHQNNGIVFGSDGSLYVTNGVASADVPDEHPWGGALLKVSPDFKKTEVFAMGFRNAFGIAINRDDEIFLADNDLEENPGDELDHVIEGEHYGHPFYYPNHPGKTPVGFRDQILLTKVTQSVYVGMAYTDAAGLPERFRDCLYIADLAANEIVRVEVKRAGDTYEVVAAEPFASIPTAVDIAIADDGTMYVASRYDKKLFRIRLRAPLLEQSDRP